MLKTLAVIAVVVAVIVAGILIYAATKPILHGEAQRRPQGAARAHLRADQHLHAWAGWSPYEKKDPDMKRTFSGAAMGKGAIYQWDGNKNVGSGTMEIIEATAPSKIVIKLDFLKPFEGHNTAEFTMVPMGDNTTVTWAMYGPSSYIFKVMGSSWIWTR
jgi:hypothetical protein